MKRLLYGCYRPLSFQCWKGSGCERIRLRDLISGEELKERASLKTYSRLEKVYEHLKTLKSPIRASIARRRSRRLSAPLHSEQSAQYLEFIRQECYPYLDMADALLGVEDPAQEDLHEVRVRDEEGNIELFSEAVSSFQRTSLDLDQIRGAIPCIPEPSCRADICITLWPSCRRDRRQWSKTRRNGC